MDILALAIGCALGGIARYILTSILRDYGLFSLPADLFVVNGLGSFFAGLLLAWQAPLLQMDIVRIFLITGFLGSFTTFSAFSVQTLVIWQQKGGLQASLYMLLSLSVALLAVILAFWVGQRMRAV